MITLRCILMFNDVNQNNSTVYNIIFSRLIFDQNCNPVPYLVRLMIVEVKITRDKPQDAIEDVDIAKSLDSCCRMVNHMNACSLAHRSISLLAFH